MVKHCMIDIETLSDKSNAIITSIAAQNFSMDGTLLESFYIDIDIQDSLACGFSVNKSTLLWWMKQSQEAVNKLVEGQEDSKGVHEALKEFASFIYETKPSWYWGNSAKFDLGKLEDYYSRCRIRIPWNTWNELCYRTECKPYKDVVTAFKKQFAGVKHNPLDDCKNQIACLTYINQSTKRWE